MEEKSWTDLRSVVIRADEMRLLLSALDLARSGCAVIVEVSGDPGAGKTHLLRAFGEELARSGIRSATASGAAAGEWSPERPFADGGEAGTPTGTPRRPETAGILDVIALLPTTRPIIERAATELVFVFDDLHLADTRTIEALEAVLRSPPRGVLVVVAHRPRQSSARLLAVLAGAHDLPNITRRIDLDGLDLDQCALLLGWPRQAPALADLHRESEGNPLYLQLLATRWAEVGVGQAAVGGGAHALLREMALLSRDESLVADTAAVLGKLRLELAAELAGLTAREVLDAASSLVQRDLLRVDHGGPPVFRFRHPVVREVRYENMDHCLRSLMHRRALGQLLHRGDISAEVDWHLERALVVSSVETVEILLRHAGQFLCLEPEAMARWTRMTIEAVAAASPNGYLGPSWTRLVILLVKALTAAGRHPESQRVLDSLMFRLADEATPSVDYARSFRVLRDCFLGNFAGGRGAASAGVVAAGPATRPVSLKIAEALGTVMETQELFPEVSADLVSLARRHGTRAEECGALAVRALGEALAGRVAEALHAAQPCAEIADMLPNDTMHLAEYLAVLGWAEILLGGSRSSERHLDRGIAIARRTGDFHALPVLLSGRGYLHIMVGDLRNAGRACAEATWWARRMDADAALGLTLMIESFCLLLDTLPGDRTAIDRAEEAVTASSSAPALWGLNPTVVLALAALAEGDSGRCVSLILEAGGGPELRALPVLLRPACFGLLTAATIAAGDHDVRWAHRAGAAARPLGLAYQYALAVLAEAHVLQSRGDSGRALTLYWRAATMFVDGGMLVARALALYLGSFAAVDAGRSDEAVDMLRRGQASALRCGARRLYAEIAEELDSLDAPRPPGDPLEEGTFAALTNREREVARVAGEGGTSREIAGRLGLSPRTVDVHLTRIYRKLNVRSKSELVRLMATVNSSSPATPKSGSPGPAGADTSVTSVESSAGSCG
ncbi:AAA family ATPase [Frankia sp. AgW1.1]|uniref:LuxR C-terminal-related transcriptional regulator n=1 Tax=Frankia sp. AgB1.8 TaxID=2792839 RepID=UPI001A5682BF|nr:AAA family ATPase [Frankia sp. AgW1.1]MBL7621888.1 AAA family ATPase [Frankia sp. AgB1.8]